MGRKEKKNTVLKLFLWLIIIGMVSYVGWAVSNIFKDLDSIEIKANDYNNMLLENISDVSDKQAEQIKSINKK